MQLVIILKIGAQRKTNTGVYSIKLVSLKVTDLSVTDLEFTVIFLSI